MRSKALIFILCIFVVGAIGAGYFLQGHKSQVAVAKNSMSQNNITKTEKIQNTTSKDTNANKTHVSTEDAKNIASKYIEEPGASPGSPKIVYIDGKPVYVVPVIKNGKQVGEIYIDVKTGKNLGGAGGAPGG